MSQRKQEYNTGEIIERLADMDKQVIHGSDFFSQAAKRLREVEKERDDWKRCCANRDITVATQGDEWVKARMKLDSEREAHSYTKGQLSTLRTAYKQALEASMEIEMLIAELEGAFMGLMMHPSDHPINGCLISVQSKEKLKCIEDIINRYKKTSTPLAIETRKGEV